MGLHEKPWSLAGSALGVGAALRVREPWPAAAAWASRLAADPSAQRRKAAELLPVTFLPPADLLQRVVTPLVNGSAKEPIAPQAVAFTQKLLQIYTQVRADTYRNHGSGAFDVTWFRDRSLARSQPKRRAWLLSARRRGDPAAGIVPSGQRGRR
jgi:hypothetical protein